MFGKNSVQKQELDDGLMLYVVRGSPFLTLQGEGPYIGMPAVFVRLHGCNLRCTFCDTNFSDPDDPVVDTLRLRDKIVSAAANGVTKLVIITGGEPLRQNIAPLCGKLKLINFKVQIETAGTLWLDGIEVLAELVCSPKTPEIHAKVYEHAIAFKYVISVGQSFNHGSRYPYVPITATQPGARAAQLASPRPGAPVYLSPMDEYDEARNLANRSLVAALAMRHGVRAGCQLHKVLNIKEPI